MLKIHHQASFVRIFSNLWHLHVVFHVGFLFIFDAWELHTIKFVICIFKARLGGEICLADVVIHMIRTIIQVSAGHYCNFQMISFFAHPFTCRYKNPVDIPLGNAKQKIKSLKARVCNQKH